MIMESKTQELLNYLLAGNSISGLEAIEKFGLYRLSSSIHRLRRKGHNIVTNMVRVDDITFARYKIKEGQTTTI